MKEKQHLEIGDKIDDLICIGRTCHISKTGNPTYYYIMKCDKCGRTKEMLSSVIRGHRGTTHKACGKGLKTQNPIFYSRWTAMRTRTTNPNYHASDRYSGRGIKSDAFANFIDFYDAMYPSYIKLADRIGEHNVSLDRIDNDGDYTPNNCRWIPVREQQSNTSANVRFIVTYPDGHKETMSDVRKFALKHGLDVSIVMDRLNPARSTRQHKGFKFERLQSVTTIPDADHEEIS